jgi:guanylate kinase
MSHWCDFDYVVVNDTFEHALGELAAIVTGRGQVSRADRPGLKSVVDSLLA